METKSVALAFVECNRRGRLWSTVMYILVVLTEAYLRMCVALFLLQLSLPKKKYTGTSSTEFKNELKRFKIATGNFDGTSSS